MTWRELYLSMTWREFFNLIIEELYKREQLMNQNSYIFKSKL